MRYENVVQASEKTPHEEQCGDDGQRAGVILRGRRRPNAVFGIRSAGNFWGCHVLCPQPPEPLVTQELCWASRCEETKDIAEENGAPERSRTSDLLVSALGGLYPAETRESRSDRIRWSSARPCPVFNCRSRFIASVRVANSSWCTTTQGPLPLVDFVMPELCWPSRCVTSAVKPT